MSLNVLHGPAVLQRDWDARMARVAALVRRRAPDIVALQEVSGAAAAMLEQALPDYALAAGPLSGASRGLVVAAVVATLLAAAGIAMLRDHARLVALLAVAGLAPWLELLWMKLHLGDFQARGEHAAVMWRRDRLERLDEQAWWLSRTPDRPGSMLPLTLGPRLVNGVRLADRATGERLFVCATHLGHAMWAGAASARVIVERLRREPSAVQVLCGDFNATPGSPMLARLQDATALDPPLRDTGAALDAGVRATWPAGTPRLCLDYVLVRGPVRVARLECCGAPDERVSDHLAIEATLERS